MFLRSPDAPLYYLSKKQLFHRYKRNAKPVYLKSCDFFGAVLIDRTHSLDSGFDFEIIDKVPSANCNYSFEDICSIRAKGILDSTSKDIHVFWSGGIDSTLALIYLISESEKTNDLQRIKVILSKESIDEYPSFFEDIVKDSMRFKLIEGSIYESVSPQDIIVTGEHGDQLFGSDKLKQTILSGDAFSPYQEILDFVISRKLGTDKFTSDIIAYLEPVIDKCPFPVITLYDYLWWVNFSLKWQTVSMRILHAIEREASDLETNVFHFFKSTHFQEWSLTHHNQKIRQEWNSYKYIAKELIYKFHKDEAYLLYKEKEPSLKEIINIKDRSSKWYGFFKRAGAASGTTFLP